MRNLIKSGIVAIALLMALICSTGAATAQELNHHEDRLTPVVLFPAFHFTVLEVKVKNQTAFPECPRSGKFEDFYLNDSPSQEFSQVCQDKLLTLVYDANPAKPMPERFSEQPGVTVEVKKYGKTESSPIYEAMYATLEAAGYKRDKNIRVAGYDSRLTPDMGDFLERAVELIEKTYKNNKNTPVHLVGHSNGPLYAQYLLTHTTQQWKNKYIHGFTPFAGNWPGQGLFYGVGFTGFNTTTFTFPTDAANAASSGAMYLSHPSTYMSLADPAIFQDQEVVVQTIQGNRSYTPQDYAQLFLDAGLSRAKELADYYIGFVKFADPASFPNVDIYAEKGSGFTTQVGVVLQNLAVGQVFDVNDPALFINRDGDINQEDITNDSIAVWENMPCFRFELTTNPLNHFQLPDDPVVLQRLLTNLRRPKSVCS
jgi:lecithin-cholesterol acyltransferase